MIGTPIVIFAIPTVYQSSKHSQNSKNDRWCTNRHMSTNSVPIVEKQSKQQKIIMGVPIVTCLHRVRLIHKVRIHRIHKAQVQCPNEVNTQQWVISLFGLVFRSAESPSERLIQKVNDPVSYYTPSSPATFVESFTTAHKTTGHGLVRFIHLTSESSARTLRFSSGRK